MVSHDNSSLINELGCLKLLLPFCKVVVKSNVSGDDFHDLDSHDNFFWLDEAYFKGFGANNNYVYEFCLDKLGMTSEDYFVVMNPDIEITPETLLSFVAKIIKDNIPFATLDLYKDRDYKIRDDSIRNFPKLKDFISSFLFNRNPSLLDRSNIKNSCNVNWAAGSFLIFLSEHYLALGGFDDNYFMYCEDIDICYRSNLLDVPLKYYPQYQALHLGSHSSRSIFSKHFRWHVSSILRYVLIKNSLLKPNFESLNSN